MRRGAPLAFLLAIPLLADGPADNRADQVRPVPPPGIAVPPDVRTKLTAKLETLRTELAALTTDAKTADLRTDVEVFVRAVGMALEHNEFFKPNDFIAAHEQLDEGLSRCRSLAKGEAPWTTKTGLVVRGHRSKLDGSVQPYGLVVPENYDPKSPRKHRLDLWLHGRFEDTLEVQFIQQRRKQKGEFTPAGTFVLHPFGRFSNAFRFAGEVDVYEALAHVRSHYPIDENRLAIRGFSMGGAGCWQFATRNPGIWAAAAPGAGFSETADFLKVFQNEKLQPHWFEQKLWNMYDSTAHAGNLFNVPTIAYSGELDRQKQAADLMVAAAKKEGLDIPHLIGPKTAHKYHPETKKELDRFIDPIVEKGREPFPKRIKFTTHTLAANECRWMSILGLERHWERAEVEGNIAENQAKVSTRNVAALSLSFGLAFDNYMPQSVVLDGKEISAIAQAVAAGPLGGSKLRFAKGVDGWKLMAEEADGRRKVPGSQGPFDDAFMSKFVFVKPTGQPLNATAGAFAERELAHAMKEWRRQYRGDVKVINDVDVSQADADGGNVIIFGDVSSNAYLKKIADKLPMKWTAEDLEVAGHKFPATHVPAMIYPNPLNPKRYVVLNSGFTFREYDYLNNARQTPKLPDWAVFDATTPMTSRAPGKLVAAGFFGEKWEPLNDPREVIK